MRAVNRDGEVRRLVAQTDVKLCALCEALNHRDNSECYLCGWHGVFEDDALRILIAWKRLEDLYEEVRWEHVAGRRPVVVEALGKLFLRMRLQTPSYRFGRWWQTFQDGREARSAARTAALRPHRIKNSA